jgi:cyclopropane fatty-acyl-phospholipid synthase-like methyltransferase
MSDFQYKKSRKYTDYNEIYAQCSGPGGLELAEFLAEKMGVTKGKLLLDIGTNRGYQTCFLAKEYGVFAVGIDPWNDRMKGNPHVEHLRDNAKKWGVEDSVLGIQVGVPETFFASGSFDYVYSTTTLEMIRVSQGIRGYMKSLEEIHRVLKPDGVFGLAEPMHLENDIPIELDPYISKGEYSWKECFRSLRETICEVKEAGFRIIEADYAPDARRWWEEFAIHDPFCKSDPDNDPKILEIDQGRWASFGYIIAKKE